MPICDSSVQSFGTWCAYSAPYSTQDVFRPEKLQTDAHLSRRLMKLFIKLSIYSHSTGKIIEVGVVYCCSSKDGCWGRGEGEWGVNHWLTQGRIQKIQKEGAECLLSPPTPWMETLLSRTCGNKVTLTFQKQFGEYKRKGEAAAPSAPPLNLLM